MEHSLRIGAGNLDRAAATQDSIAPSYQAYKILHLGFTVAPILAGLDKFLHVLTDWDKYLPSVVNNLVGGHGHTLMLAVGIIEVIAGIGVALKPRVFSYVVAAWLTLIALSLLTTGQYTDVAVRDLVMACGAFVLARLSEVRQEEGISVGSLRTRTV